CSNQIIDDDDTEATQQLIQAENGVVPSGRQKGCPPGSDLLRRRSNSDDKNPLVGDDVSSSSSRPSPSKYTASKRQSPASQSQEQQQQPKLSRNTQLAWACIVGIVGGAATMLTNAMGPILNVYLLSVVQLSPSAYIGTRALFFCFLNVGKLPMRFLAGTLGWQMLPLAGFLGLFSVTGVFGAKPIMLSMKEEHFVYLELAVVAFSGLRLCYMGLFP
ncbi:MAG: hypothetical protein SGARI_003667, partial [Bacillariaceae sp.]